MEAGGIAKEAGPMRSAFEAQRRRRGHWGGGGAIGEEAGLVQVYNNSMRGTC